jgi:conjugal transfer pilus assembly protein TraU
MIRKVISIVLISIFISITPIAEKNALSAQPGCKATPGDAVKILMTSMSTLTNVFPIRLAGIQVINLGGVDDFNSISSSPICICNMPPPIFIRAGLPLSMWEAGHLMETVKHPWCSPSVGIQLPVPFNQQAMGSEGQQETSNSQHAAAQVHMVIYPVWILIGLFVDVMCFQYAKSFDYLYVTEIDPLWQNDMWATLLGPEAILVANPVAQMACSIDSMKATINRGLDPLFWCMGAWGSTYPMSENITSAGYVQANAGLASRMIAKLHREMLLWGTIGNPTVSGTCQRYPMPMWMKRQYNLLLLHPIADSKRRVIGKPGILWTSGKNVPFTGDDFVFMLYNKRDCCLF